MKTALSNQRDNTLLKVQKTRRDN